MIIKFYLNTELINKHKDTMFKIYSTIRYKETKVLQRNKDSLTTNITIYLASYAILEIWNIEI